MAHPAGSDPLRLSCPDCDCTAEDGGVMVCQLLRQQREVEENSEPLPPISTIVTRGRGSLISGMQLQLVQNLQQVGEQMTEPLPSVVARRFFPYANEDGSERVQRRRYCGRGRSLSRDEPDLSSDLLFRVGQPPVCSEQPMPPLTDIAAVHHPSCWCKFSIEKGHFCS